MPFFLNILVFFLTFGLSFETYASYSDSNPHRFIDEIEAFEVWDSKNSYPKNSILFIGSSSIRFWKTSLAFPDVKIINRGFGGSEISDINYFYNRIVRPYVAEEIFLYAGDNDIARGKTVDQVFEDYLDFVKKVQSDFPETKITFISIKPSKSRWDKWPKMKKVNAMIKNYAEKKDKLEYADLASPLINSEGNLKNVFIQDGLHLNQFGYSLWQKALAPSLK